MIFKEERELEQLSQENLRTIRQRDRKAQLESSIATLHTKISQARHEVQTKQQEL